MIYPYRPKSDATLKSYSKEILIEHIRLLESNWMGAEGFNERQFMVLRNVYYKTQNLIRELKKANADSELIKSVESLFDYLDVRETADAKH